MKITRFTEERICGHTQGIAGIRSMPAMGELAGSLVA